VKSQSAYLKHIWDCIGRISQNTSQGREAFLQSHTLQDAIVRNLQVICESARRLNEGLIATHPEIDWKSIAGLRNVLVHDYFDVDLESIRTIVARDLPPL
jgi:uncharacterized protein with HEPN domain